jgi:hypothetical protein
MTIDKKTEHLQIISLPLCPPQIPHSVCGVESNAGLRGELSTNQSSE